MTYKEEIQRLVLNNILKVSHPGQEVTERQWKIANDLVKADCMIETLQWKIDHLWATR